MAGSGLSGADGVFRPALHPAYGPEAWDDAYKAAHYNRLRAAPSPAGTVIANLPNGAEVTVYGEWNGWYVVQYGDQVGYAAAAYIDV